MKIIYYCYGRAHSSVIAGYIHLRKLPLDRKPTLKELFSIPEFDQSQPKDWGIPYFLGKDEQNNDIYIIGFGKNHTLGLQTIYYTLQGLTDPLDWRFFNTLDQIDFVTKIGGFMSRALKLIFPGRIIVAFGIQRSYFNLVKLVKFSKGLNQTD